MLVPSYPDFGKDSEIGLRQKMPSKQAPALTAAAT
jgi:hypothetical protein